MRYFVDTEFIEDGRTIDLVSVGVVAEDGRELYREVDPAEVPWDRANEWVRANVKPYLSYGVMPQARPIEVVRFCEDIACELVEFVGERPEFWGYYADYDWVAIAQLYGTMMDLPEGWPMFCMDLKQLAVSKGDPELPRQESTEHHALADARWNRDIYNWLMAR